MEELTESVSLSRTPNSVQRISRSKWAVHESRKGVSGSHCRPRVSTVQLQGQLAGQRSQRAWRKALHSSAVSCKVLGKGELVDCKNQRGIMEAQTEWKHSVLIVQHRACPWHTCFFVLETENENYDKAESVRGYTVNWGDGKNLGLRFPVLLLLLKSVEQPLKII